KIKHMKTHLNKFRFVLVTILIIFIALKINVEFLQTNMTIIYSIILVILLLTIFGLLTNSLIKVKNYFKIRKITRTVLILIFFLALSLRLFFMPHYHLFTPDDYWLMEQGKNFLTQGKAEICSYSTNGEEVCSLIKSTGYPTILAINFLTFGINNYYAMYFTAIISSFLVVIIFYLSYLIFNSERAALFSALVLSFDKLNLYLSSHVENMNPAIIFLSLSMIFFILYFRNKDLKTHLLAISLFSISMFIRIEYALFLILLVPLYLYNVRKELNKEHFIFPTTIFVIIVLFFLLQIPAISSVGYNSQFSFTNLKTNILTRTTSFYQNYGFLLTALFFIGAIFGIRNDFLKTSMIILSMLIFLVFYFTWTQTNLYRVMMTVFVHGVIIMGLGFDYVISKVKDRSKNYAKIITIAIIVLVIIISMPQLIAQKQNILTRDVHIQNTVMLERLKEDVPDNCFVIVERPVFITATTNIKAVSTIEVYNNKNNMAKLLDQSGCVYFYENDLCFENIDVGPGRTAFGVDSTGRCEEIKKNYNLQEVKSYKFDKYTYKLYRVSL
ncbi:MAG: glycosyltransferase family 39 protein, partial [Nanoarchaeota archaeon]|nr:glycosyltransferase family 39 protein [Nanoarchaeota archaeon]